MKRILICVLISACGPAQGTEVTSISEQQGDCGAEAFQNLVGQELEALPPTRFPELTRIIRPGDAVTADYNPERLNVEIDADGKVAQIRCG